MLLVSEETTSEETEAITAGPVAGPGTARNERALLAPLSALLDSVVVLASLHGDDDT
jgi:hypothetical protein